MSEDEIRIPTATPLEVVNASVALIDVRDRDEREGVIGFIPGSRSFPAAQLRADPLPLLDAYPPGMRFVLVCLSGRRSASLVATFLERGFDRVSNLEGGVLAWQAAGLPMCGVQEPPEESIPHVATIDDLPRRIISCFVAEAAEAALDSGVGPIDDDPKSIAEALLASAKSDEGLSPAAVLDALERLGEIARFRGHPLSNIARNLDVMRAAVRPFLRDG